MKTWRQGKHAMMVRCKPSMYAGADQPQTQALNTCMFGIFNGFESIVHLAIICGTEIDVIRFE